MGLLALVSQVRISSQILLYKSPHCTSRTDLGEGSGRKGRAEGCLPCFSRYGLAAVGHHEVEQAAPRHPGAHPQGSFPAPQRSLRHGQWPDRKEEDAQARTILVVRSVSPSPRPGIELTFPASGGPVPSWICWSLSSWLLACPLPAEISSDTVHSGLPVAPACLHVVADIRPLFISLLMLGIDVVDSAGLPTR